MSSFNKQLPDNAKEAEEWLANEWYFNSGHLSEIEAIAGKTIDDVREERGLTQPDDPKPAILTPEQLAAEQRIYVALERRLKKLNSCLDSAKK
jgi:hypothetical protein